MAWRDQMRQPSFKGIPLHVDEDQGELGVRGELHEYAMRDIPYFEELGRAARRYQVNAYHLGDNYPQLRDRLFKAVEEGGKGTLVHPWLGELQVVCTSLAWRHTQREGGRVDYIFAFVEAGDNVHPVARPQTPRLTRRQADAALGAMRTAFAGNYRVAGQPGFLADAAGAMLQDFAGTVAGARGLSLAGSTAAVVTGPLETLLLGMIDEPAFAAARPDLADVIASAIGLFARPTPASVPEPATLRGLEIIERFGDGYPVPPLTTLHRQRQYANQLALIHLVERIAVVERARASASIQPDSYQAAVALRDRLTADIDRVSDIAADAGEDVAWRALIDLRARVVEDLTARAATLDPLIRYRVARPTASLALAWRLYQDAERDVDLVRRNPVVHPGFMPLDGEALAR